jgi:DNA repair exonuclease SbcCD nuclease subunit
MSKIAIITDTHFGARSDSTYMHRSQQKFLDDIFFPTLDEHGVQHVLHGGDYGDRRKYINFATARFIEEHYRQPLRARGLTEDVIVGNHDCFLRESTEVNSIQELYRHDATIRVYTQPAELDLDGCGVLLLPWICDNNRAATEHAISTSNAQVVLGHLELNGFSMYRGMPNHEGMDPSVFDRFPLVLSGHFHHRSAKPPVQYLGAPYPMVWSDYRDPRGFHILDTETLDLTFFANPYSMFMRTVYDDADQPPQYIEKLVQDVMAPTSPYHDAYVKIVVKSKTQPYWFDLLLDALSKVNAQDVMVVDDIATATDAGTEDVSTDIDTLTLIHDYVENLSLTCDKIELQQYLQDTYREAMSVTQSARVQ